MGVFLAAARFELAVLRRSPSDLIALANTPLLTVIFLAITRHAGRADLAPYAVLAPAVIGVWLMALLVSGEIVDRARWDSTLEALVATPAPLTLVVLGRITTVTGLSLLAVLESWLVGRLGFGVAIDVHHPVLFVLTLLVLALAIAGTATAMSAVFVLARTARTFQNALSYPVYLLGGAFVPVDLLPGWLRPLSRLVFLSWATDLLRDGLSAAPVPAAPARLAVVLGLGLAAFLGGVALLHRFLDKVRALGTLDHA
jgi:ABC-2 type transport system permease protein